MPMPYRHIAATSVGGLGAGILNWNKFPKRSDSRPFGFSQGCLGSNACVASHARSHLDELEAFDKSAAAMQLRPDEAISIRDGWWRWDGIPDNEKYFFFHVLNRSLIPVSFLDLFNHQAPAEAQVSFLGRSNGLLMPERHHPNCSCVCTNLR